MSQPSYPSPVPVAPGDILAGKYRVTRILGAGGMGVVVAAHHLQLDQPVALKFLLPGSVADASVRSRFLREGQAAAKIRSEHVARVLDVGTLETGAPYLVMELLEGADLGEHVRRSGPLPLDVAVEFVLQASHAIGVAHGLGIVHRDLKPANLFVTMRPDGSTCVKVLDFGISKMQSEGARHDMTATGAVLGTPFYMSPEQFMNAKGVDLRSDVWSLGAVLYELLMGKPPFDGESIGQLVAHVLTKPMPALARPDLPAAFRPCSHERSPRVRTTGTRAWPSSEPRSARSRANVRGRRSNGSRGWRAHVGHPLPTRPGAASRRPWLPVQGGQRSTGRPSHTAERKSSPRRPPR